MKKIILGVTIILIGLFLITFSVVKQSSKISVTPTQLPLVESNAVELPVSEFDSFYGNPGSPVTVDEFFSFNCAECISLHEQLISYVNSHQGKVRLRATGILKTNWFGQQEDSLPLVSLACAEQQEKYWPFLNKILKISKPNEEVIKSLIQELKLNETDFNTCLTDETIQNKVQNKQITLKYSGLSKTPFVFINNRQINLTNDVKIAEILNGVITE
ncbi:MAG: thioredoxin domain-containing protein [Candidatus Magasanikbacteria bacterium]|nr:thioredoxin domain-containing protein [Candidatus Magasanikbacteria bacterium]